MKKELFAFIIISLSLVEVLPAQVQSKTELSGKSAYIQGLQAFENKDYETARDYLLQAHQSLGGSSGITFALADTYLMLGDLNNAIKYGKKAVAGEPENKWYRFKLAEIYRTAGKNDATLSELTTLLEYHPADFEALYLLANTYENYGEFKKANLVFDRILKITGPDINLYLSKLKNWEKLNQPDSVLTVLENIRKADPDNLQALNLLGEYYAKNGYRDKAKNVLQEALNRNARDPQTLINLAGLFLEEGEWETAGNLFCQFISDNLVQVEEKLRISQYLFTQVQTYSNNEPLKEQAEKIFTTFIEHEPHFGPAFSLFGQFLAEIGEPQKAVTYLTKASRLIPYDATVWRQLIQILIDQKELDKTIETGIKADNYVPDDAFIQFFVGSAYILKDDYKNAQNWLEKASRAPARRPLKSLIYTSLADTYANLGDYDSAVNAYEFALRYDKENVTALNSYASFLLSQNRKLNKAEELILAALDAEPKNAAYLETAGKYYFKKGNNEEALNYLKMAFDNGNHTSEVSELIGDIFERLNKPKEAQDWWKKALELDKSKTHLQNKIQ